VGGLTWLIGAGGGSGTRGGSLVLQIGWGEWGGELRSAAAGAHPVGYSSSRGWQSSSSSPFVVVRTSPFVVVRTSSFTVVRAVVGVG
jgi:hypothetical protein